MYRWNETKNTLLIRTRRIGFQEVVDAIENGNLIESIIHPNQSRYPNQFILFVCIRNYVYAIPYVIEKNGFFLKTIYKSREATKKYLKGIKK